jgi:Ca2+-binding RTX toxin-like protein
MGTDGGQSVEISRSTITGDVFLGGGNDTLRLSTRMGSLGFSTTTIGGTADGGAGADRLALEIDTGETVDLSRYLNFETIDLGLSTTTQANLTLINLPSSVGTLRMDNGESAVRLGGTDLPNMQVEYFGGAQLQVLSGARIGSITDNFAYTPTREVLHNAGTIVGSITLGDKNTEVVNTGVIGGAATFGNNSSAPGEVRRVSFTNAGETKAAVTLGAGDDIYEELAGAITRGPVTGGLGNDLFTVRGSSGTYRDGQGFDLIELAGAAGATVNARPGEVVLATSYVIAGFDVIRGTSFGDRLNGTSDAETIEGRSGLDVLSGLSGSDTLDGGAGEDVADYASSPAGVVATIRDAYAEDGFGGRDTLVTIEHLYGSSHADVLVGHAGYNTLAGQGGNDKLYGLGGDDVLEGEAGADLIDGGEGRDRVTFEYGAAAVVVSLRDGYAEDGYGTRDTLVSIEDAYGSRFRRSRP